MKTAIQKYKANAHSVISFNELNKLPIGDLLNIDSEGKVQTTRIPNEQGDLSFRVTMEKDSSWTIHSHDCEETILLYKGSLRDSLQEIKLKPLHCMTIPKHTTHKIEALDHSIFYVEFKKPN